MAGSAGSFINSINGIFLFQNFHKIVIEEKINEPLATKRLILPP
jgi:hypothetical protein